MKSCPTCNRTFEDTFTFCLIDGSVLGAPFEPAVGKSPKSNRDPGPVKTEAFTAETATLAQPVAGRPANLNRDAVARETDPARRTDTDSALQSTIRGPIPPPAPTRVTDGRAQQQTFAPSGLIRWTYGIR